MRDDLKSLKTVQSEGQPGIIAKDQGQLPQGRLKNLNSKIRQTNSQTIGSEQLIAERNVRSQQELISHDRMKKA